MSTTINVELSTRARGFIGSEGLRNRAGQTLRQWLHNAMLPTASERLAQQSLLGDLIPVEDDVPFLLEAVSMVLKRSVGELVEQWALEERGPLGVSAPERATSSLAPQTREKAGELLDLAETLLEESISDARRRLGSYSEGDEALKAAADVFAALRRVLGLALAESELPK